jgi:hypothetical protein
VLTVADWKGEARVEMNRETNTTDAFMLTPPSPLLHPRSLATLRRRVLADPVVQEFVERFDCAIVSVEAHETCGKPRHRPGAEL